MALAVGVTLLAAAGCGKPPDDSKDGGSGAFTACMVTDTGGVDDKSFNASVWKGLQDAKGADGDVNPSYVSSNSEADYEPNLNASVDKGCKLIVAVGGLMSDATKKVAQANPNSHFAIVDAKIDLPNVYSMEFNTAQAAFQAGYLAAGMSQTKKVATWGGMKIPPVTIFMDGFADGVAYYNSKKGTSVEVLGWDVKAQNGSFTNNFADQTAGKTLTDSLVAQGADVVMPVAGNSSLGAANVAKDKGGALTLVWVDFDGCTAAPEYCPYFLTSVVKEIPGIVQQATVDAAKGTFRTGAYVGQLNNQGVKIAPYHDFDAKVPAELKAEVVQVGADISAGTIQITSPSQPS
ncbi:BMP family ABC transporter substrate-binding protein [Actinorhabdospora filicis]|uniref:BMP family ABC transporter substrate-binding protein n=1 Tax=Actinorhabdospora filicis TaxID=1785913 RepID=A0A9W6WDN0_9ACTN|nr:BMP family ABC transporter substrate-binding protein [Actinorhabdospora filicis]